MQKGLIGILGVLVLFLAAVDVRLSSRARLLEEQLATAQKRPALAPTPAPLSGPVPESPRLVPVPVISTASVTKDHDPKPASPNAAPNVRPEENAVYRDQANLWLEQRFKALELTLHAGSANALPLTVLATEANPETGAGPRAGFLGISGDDVPGGGVKVQAVVADSVALRSDLRPDDIILEFNGERIDTLAALAFKIQGAGEGSPASLRIRRDGVEFYQGVQLGSRSPTQR
jgi:membrane-associated protease RseP (regulator of RpoE activity)